MLMETILEESVSELAPALANVALEAPEPTGEENAIPPAKTKGAAAATIPWADRSLDEEEAEEDHDAPDPLNETIRPVRGNQGLSRREEETMQEKWEALRTRLDSDLQLDKRANVAIDTGEGELRAFIRQYGAEGRNLARHYQRRMAYARGRRDAAKAWQAAEDLRVEKRVEVERRILALRERAYRFADTTRAEAEALQAELNEVRDQDPAIIRPSTAYKCPVCRLVGVQRGSECPNVLEHRRA